MAKGSKGDIRYLKLKLMLYLCEENYERAEVMRKWIVELGGNPEIEDIDTILTEIHRKSINKK